MARINMIKAAVSRRTSAHAPMDNVTTPYNPIRLLKGAPPGQVSSENFLFCCLKNFLNKSTLQIQIDDLTYNTFLLFKGTCQLLCIRTQHHGTT